MYSPFIADGTNTSEMKRSSRRNGGPNWPRKVRNQAASKVAAPVAMGARVMMNSPNVSQLKDGRIRVNHTEYLGEVSIGGTTYSSTTYSINPGMFSTFPWLSTIAQQYESYRFSALRFKYEPQAPTSAPGSIMMAVDFDAADAAPASKLALMSNHHAVRSPVWSSSVYALDVMDAAKLGGERFVRSGALAANLDVKVYDVGSLFVGTVGTTLASAGELYVEYTVELITPQIDLAGLASSLSAKVAGNTGIDKTHVFGTAAATVTGSLACSAITNTLTINRPGQFMIEVLETGTGIGAAPTATLAAAYGTITAIGGTYNAGGDSLARSWYVDVIQSGAPVVFDASAHTTVTAFAMRIAAYAAANA